MKEISIVVFVLVVIIKWLSVHWKMNVLFVATPLLVCGVIFGFLFVWLYYYRRESHYLVSVSPFGVVSLGALLSVFLFNVVTFFRPLVETRLPVLGTNLWFSSNLSFVWKEFVLIVAMMCAVAIFYVLGVLLETLIFKRGMPFAKDALLHFLIVVSIGIFGWVFISFLIAFFGFFSQVVLFGVVVFVILTGWRQVRKISMWFFTPLKRDINICSSHFWLWLLVMLFVVFNLVNGLRPIPVGYDDMTYYMNHVGHIVEKGQLVGGGNAYPFELLVASFQVLTQSISLGMSMSILCVVLGFLGVYGFGRYYWNETSGLVAGTVWISLSTTSALAVREAKPDTLLFFLSSMVLWLFFVWLREKRDFYIYLLSFLFGFAFTVKLTAVFLLAPLLVGLVLAWKEQSCSMKEKARILVVVCLFAVIPLLHWIAYGFETRNGNFPESIIGWISSVTSREPITVGDWKSVGIDPEKQCHFTGSDEDYGTYEGKGNKIVNFLLLPWSITMNSRVGSFVLEIGFLFLALLPIVLLWRGKLFFEKWGLMSKGSMLVVMAIAYWFLWSILANRILWYGFPGFFFLCLLVAMVVSERYEHRWFRNFLWGVLFLGLIANTMIRLEYFGNQHVLRYAAGAIDENEFADAYFPGYRQAAEIVATTDGGKVLMTQSKAYYFMPENDSRVLQDGYLDIFYCLYSEGDDKVTMDRLRKLDFRFIFFTKSFLNVLQNPDDDTLKQKVSRFVQFANGNLKTIMNGPDFILYEIPR